MSPSEGASAPVRERWSVLAILSVVVLVIPIVGPLAGMAFGVMALIRLGRRKDTTAAQTRASEPASRRVSMRGRRLAITGVIAGAVLLLVEQWALSALRQSYTRQIDQGVSVATERLFRADTAASADEALTGWSGHVVDRVTRAEVIAFAAEAQARYGAYRSLSVERAEPEPPTFTRQALRMSVTFRFEGGDRLGSIVAVLASDPANPFSPLTYLADVTIDDREAGALRVGPPLPTKEATDAR